MDTAVRPYVGFGDAIRKARLDRGWCVTEAARRLSRINRRRVSRQYVSLLEQGRHRPAHQKTVRGLAVLYRLPVADLLGLLGWPDSAPMTFGAAIYQARMRHGWSLRKVCATVAGPGGTPISPQYLGQLESGARDCPGHRVVNQLAETLALPADWLFYLLGQFPPDLRRENLPADVVCSVLRTLRSA